MIASYPLLLLVLFVCEFYTAHLKNYNRLIFVKKIQMWLRRFYSPKNWASRHNLYARRPQKGLPRALDFRSCQIAPPCYLLERIVDDKNFSNLPTQVSRNKCCTLRALEIHENLYGCYKLKPYQMRKSLLFSRVYPDDELPFRQSQRVTVEFAEWANITLSRRNLGRIKLEVTIVVYALFCSRENVKY